jgi:hypothetical protein
MDTQEGEHYDYELAGMPTYRLQELQDIHGYL